MIPDLLWRCPLCQKNDALKHQQRWLQPDILECTVCCAQWRVRRVVGDNYYLKITRIGQSESSHKPGFELSITAWYDLMKQTVHLQPLTDCSVLLEPKEELYLASGETVLWIDSQPAVTGANVPGSLEVKKRSISSTKVKDAQAEGELIGPGQLFLTNQRMIWRQSPEKTKMPNPSNNSKLFVFPLQRLNGVYTVLNLGLLIVEGTDQYNFRTLNESPLKWVNYVALLAPQVQVESGHRIQTSHY